VGLVFVENLAELYARALRRSPNGAEVFNVTGARAGNDEVIAGIRKVAPDAAISFSGPDLASHR